MEASQNFVIISITPWDFEMGNNAKNLAFEISLNHKVLYVNPPLDRFTLIKEKNTKFVSNRIAIKNGEKSDIEVINENLIVFTPSIIIESINWLPSRYLFEQINKLNNIKFAKEINRVLKQKNMDFFYLINDSDMFRSFYLKEYLKPLKYIYYSRDNLMAVDYWRKYGQYYEPKLIAKSDLAIANSNYLTRELNKYNQNSFDVGQGCDLGVFNLDDHSLPADMENIEGPIIGYTGALFSLRLDIDLLAFIAKSKPEWSIVLVGPEDKDFKNSALHELKNVYFLGNKAPELLNQYISNFDVCINPQLVNEVTIGNYPRKIDEYLALGKPIVATHTIAMENFEPEVFLAKNYFEYIHFIKLALTENSIQVIEARKNLAASHSWGNNVKKIFDAIDKCSSNT
jgi:glycosyltransferase involved in cell wall biosynthesis